MLDYHFIILFNYLFLLIHFVLVILSEGVTAYFKMLDISVKYSYTFHILNFKRKGKDQRICQNKFLLFPSIPP